MGKETLSTEEIIFTFSFLAQQVVFMYHKPKKCIFAIQSAQNPNLSPLRFLELLKVDFSSCLRFKFQVPDVPFFGVPGFTKMRQKRQNFTKISKWVVNNRNDTKCLPVLSFCVQLQNFLFQNLSKLGSAFFGVPQNAENGHFWRFEVPQKRPFPILKRFETKCFVIGVQKLRS